MRYLPLVSLLQQGKLYSVGPLTATFVINQVHVQTVKKQGAAQFQTGVMKVDLSAAFDKLRRKLGGAAAGLNDLEAMAIDTDVQERKHCAH